jgi:hypothetical protein
MGSGEFEHCEARVAAEPDLWPVNSERVRLDTGLELLLQHLPLVSSQSVIGTVVPRAARPVSARNGKSLPGLAHQRADFNGFRPTEKAWAGASVRFKLSGIDTGNWRRW